jgi:beta-lactam-binding protein with PASTA domain
LRGDNLSTTTACDPASQNLVVATSPMVANQVEIGSQVTLITCGRNVRVPSVVGDTVDQATAAIQSPASSSARSRTPPAATSRSERSRPPRPRAATSY